MAKWLMTEKCPQHYITNKTDSNKLTFSSSALSLSEAAETDGNRPNKNSPKVRRVIEFGSARIREGIYYGMPRLGKAGKYALC